MIRLASVREVKQLSGFEIWYIVRSPKNLRFDENHKHVPELSPASQLFYSYLNAAKMGDWNAEWFAEHYVPNFLRQMKSDAAQEKLSELVVRSQSEDIALVCFCSDESLCHRSIVGGILYNMGAYCDPAIEAAYSKYKI
jgi:uncharacterized protein YeaO (DUF488 family)